MATETKQLGQILKSLRKEHRLTGEELGKRVNLSQSKISKIETGYYPHLHPKEIENILNILDAPKTIRQQINRLLDEIEPEISQQRPYFLPPRALTSEKQANDIKLFVYNAIPNGFQTYSYREAVLVKYGHSPEEISLYIQDTLRLQEFVWNKQRTYHAILHQTALYTCPVSKGQQLAQLDRLQMLMDLSSVKIGIIPFEAGMTLVENSNFAIHDNKRLVLCLAKNEVETDDIEDIATHKRLFLELDHLAHYGDEAKKLIRQAMEYFS